MGPELGRENSQFEGIREALLPYYQRYLEYLSNLKDRNISPDDPSHPDQMEARGHLLRRVRRNLKLTDMQFAEKIGVDPIQVHALEAGIIPPADIPNWVHPKIQEVLRQESA